MSAKKMAKKIAKKKAKPAAKKRRLPRKEDVPDYSPGLPDMEKWPEIAIVLKVRPFYNGKDSVPFSRLRARLVRDSTDVHHPMKNSFYLGEAAQ